MLESLLWQTGFCVCHQRPERSFFMAGHQLPLCARCTGIHLGFLITAAYNLLRGRWHRAGSPDRWVLAVAVLGSQLMILDGVTSYAGLRETTNLIRLASGLGMGLAIGLILPMVMNLQKREQGEGDSRPTSTWQDLIPLTGMLVGAGLLVLREPESIEIFYAVSILSISGYLIGFFLLMTLLLRLVRNSSGLFAEDWPRSRRVVVQGCLMGVLWGVHYLAVNTV